MKVYKLPSGNYRIQFYIDKKRRSITLDHKVSEREADRIVADIIRNHNSVKNESFKTLALEYIDAKENVLSPNTRRGYTICLKRLSSRFLNSNIAKIDQILIQREINELSSKYSPKTVKNTYGFISAVFDMFRPNTTFKITFPQKNPYNAYCPTNDDIRLILKNCKDNYIVPFSLGILGMRRGEIAAAELSDLSDDGILSISKSTYRDENNNHGIKTTKTDTSTRSIYIPEELADRIRKQGYICNVSEGRLWAYLKALQVKLDIPHFRFHDLRVYYASYAHAMGIPDKYIQEAGGWKTDYTMKQVYRKAMADEYKKSQLEYHESIKNFL